MNEQQMNKAIFIKALALSAAIQRVRDLHKPFSPTDVICDCCACVYPCSTIQALDGEQ